MAPLLLRQTHPAKGGLFMGAPAVRRGGEENRLINHPPAPLTVKVAERQAGRRFALQDISDVRPRRPGCGSHPLWPIARRGCARGPETGRTEVRRFAVPPVPSLSLCMVVGTTAIDTGTVPREEIPAICGDFRSKPGKFARTVDHQRHHGARPQTGQELEERGEPPRAHRLKRRQRARPRPGAARPVPAVSGGSPPDRRRGSRRP